MSRYYSDDERKDFREPGPGETACDECERGIRHWIEDVREGYEVCATCNGSGCVQVQVLHPVFERVFDDMRKIDEPSPMTRDEEARQTLDRG